MLSEMGKSYALIQTLSTASVFASIGLAVFCYVADCFAQLSFILQNDWLRALSDNAIHGVVGSWSWAIVIGLRKKSDFYEVILAGFLSSVIDLDHFIAAGSFSLKAALNLPRRPPLHCSTVIPVVVLLIKVAMRLFKLKDSLCFLPWMVFISWTSHHVRDGVRQGLWLCPFGSTAALPYWLYITITATLPYLSSVLMYLTGTQEMMSLKHGILIDV
ncbi:transmembrane protein 267 [Protopterus annectens]|uniref:transmembrane protein 267 n=1 Tax=Protopterus annectens TaxID=7888 RepID=UPI001CF9AC67|nr:transmembrane protein 267 [Protopterus annectens]XP_043932784.1 transmembrane protein 267 [Protopterus annectens]XP_043932794.1 transmembrane protein 267 [Protopterus annectens]XP_043932801.1 transmembrane protein 267 [Protopterus annectens]XP_043932810.1 transmembrane protein 267 [Protopterus annectens]